MIGAKPPSLQKGEHSMYPPERNVGRHVTDDTRIVAVFSQPRIGCMAICQQGRSRRDVGLDEAVNMCCLVARDDSQANAPGHSVEVLRPKGLGLLRLFPGSVAQFNRADNQYLPGLERSIWIIVGAEWHFRLIDLYHALKRIATGIDHRTPQLLFHQPSRAISDSQLPSQLPGRHSIGMRGHQMRRPVPISQRQFGSVHDRTRRRRRLPTAHSTLIGIGTALKQVARPATAFRAEKAVRPPPIHQQADAAFLIRKPRLEFKK